MVKSPLIKKPEDFVPGPERHHTVPALSQCCRIIVQQGLILALSDRLIVGQNFIDVALANNSNQVPRMDSVPGLLPYISTIRRRVPKHVG